MQVSRYDPQAPWFMDYSREWAPTSAPLLPEDLSGLRVLDLACGWGPLSRELAGRGALVTGVELSRPLLERGRQLEDAAPLGIAYVHGDASALEWWDGQPFDAVVCNMALMDIDDLDGAMASVHAVLRPGGWFNVSILHPCYPGEQLPGGDASPSWPPENGYDREGWRTTEAIGVRGHVGAIHRRLSTYLNAILAAGLEFTRFTEPPAPVPCILIIDGRRPHSSA